MHSKFIQDFIDKIRYRTPRAKYSVPFKKPQKTYKDIVCLVGFGHSGSGALLDYLSEFQNVTCVGYHDKAFSGYKNDKSSVEFDFIRGIGGVLELENAFERPSGYYNDDFALKLFLQTSSYFYRKGGIYNDEYWRLTLEFTEQLVDYKLLCKRGTASLSPLSIKPKYKEYKNLPFYLGVTKQNSENNYIYHLKKLSKDKYQKLAKEYIKKVLKTINSNEHLVLDQALTTFSSDLSHKEKYFDNLKLITCYRDPRDVYVTGMINKCWWIPSEPQTFCKWYIDRGTKSYLEENSSKKLVIKFEDFVLNPQTRAAVNDFVGLSETEQIFANKYFKPEISKNNVGIYKSFENQDSIKYIASELSEFCYKEEI